MPRGSVSAPVSLEAIQEIVRNELQRSIEPLIKEIKAIKSENLALRKIICEQQTSLERLEIERRASNLVISGITEKTETSPTNDIDKVKSILEKIRLTCNSPPPMFNIVKLRRLGKFGGRPRLIVATMENSDIKHQILSNSKCLRSDQETRQVFISPDLPILTRNENSRLRKEAKSAKEFDSKRTVIIKQGKLTIDGTETDKFDIANQLFRE